LVNARLAAANRPSFYEKLRPRGVTRALPYRRLRVPAGTSRDAQGTAAGRHVQEPHARTEADTAEAILRQGVVKGVANSSTPAAIRSYASRVSRSREVSKISLVTFASTASMGPSLRRLCSQRGSCSSRGGCAAQSGAPAVRVVTTRRVAPWSFVLKRGAMVTGPHGPGDVHIVLVG
jgi:hypothetical protein